MTLLFIFLIFGNQIIFLFSRLVIWQCIKDIFLYFLGLLEIKIVIKIYKIYLCIHGLTFLAFFKATLDLQLLV